MLVESDWKAPKDHRVGCSSRSEASGVEFLPVRLRLRGASFARAAFATDDSSTVEKGGRRVEKAAAAVDVRAAVASSNGDGPS